MEEQIDINAKIAELWNEAEKEEIAKIENSYKNFQSVCNGFSKNLNDNFQKKFKNFQDSWANEYILKAAEKARQDEVFRNNLLMFLWFQQR